jgi:cyclopropane-fatty-acyl-phospholipid synthase
MPRKDARQVMQGLLASADVRVDGDRPWDIHVRNQDFFERVLAGGSLALGESYMDGWWDCEALDQFFDHILRARLDKKARLSREVLWAAVRARLTNLQRRSRAFDIGRQHYDLGNRLFSVMLDKGMNYSCAYWENARTLDQAQQAKLDLICRKLDLKPHMTVLDIGCGWGGFARHAAETYGVTVVGITVSRRQAEFARHYCRGLPVRIEMQDYRSLRETVDRIVSIGMFEHVGCRNYRTFMKTVHRCLKPDGLFLLHSIGGNTSVRSTDPWIDRYIFPNSMLPSAAQIASAAEGLFVLEDWHSFGPHYDTTIMAWHRNFTTGWHRIKENYDDRFFRMWVYYLLSCAGSFRARVNQLWQIVFSKTGVRGGYRRICTAAQDHERAR